MNFLNLKEKLNQIRDLIRIENDNVLYVNATRCLALIFLADYYQVFYAFKYKKWNDCAMHKLAGNLARVEKIFMGKKNDLVDFLDLLILDRCLYAHGDVNLVDVEIDIDDIEKFTNILDSLITEDIYHITISLNVKNIP